MVACAERLPADVVDVHPVAVRERLGRRDERDCLLGDDRPAAVAHQHGALAHPSRHLHHVDALELAVDDADEPRLDVEPRDRNRGRRGRAAAGDDPLRRNDAVVGARVARHGVDRVARRESDADDQGATAPFSRLSPVSGEKK